MSIGKAAAEHAAAMAETLLGSRAAELEQLQARHGQASSDQAAECERLRQQLHEVSRLHTASAHQQQELSQQLQAAASGLADCRASLAVERAAGEQAQDQLRQAQRELDAARAAQREAQAAAKQLEVLLAECDAERRVLRSKYMNLGGCLLQMLSAAVWACCSSTHGVGCVHAACTHHTCACPLR
jgi:chromosome segregation ATPase